MQCSVSVWPFLNNIGNNMSSYRLSKLLECDHVLLTLKLKLICTNNLLLYQYLLPISLSVSGHRRLTQRGRGGGSTANQHVSSRETRANGCYLRALWSTPWRRDQLAKCIERVHHIWSWLSRYMVSKAHIIGISILLCHP